MGLLDKFKKTKLDKDSKEMKDNKAILKEKAEVKVDTDKKTGKGKKDSGSSGANDVNREKKEKITTSKKKVQGTDNKVLIRPFISEKAAIQEVNGVYTFVVNNRVNKIQVKEAVKMAYGVIPKKVRIMNFEGKNMRFGKNKGRRSDWKKAVITLAKGQSINIHEGV